MHILYRFLGRTGQLLYVGVTNNPPQRFRQHLTDKEWWWEVGTILIEHFASREELLASEARAIRLEGPLYNIQGNHNQGNLTFNLAFDLTPCPACDKESFYRLDQDRYYHNDGTENHECWCALMRGEGGGYTTDRWGRIIDDRRTNTRGSRRQRHQHPRYRTSDLR